MFVKRAFYVVNLQEEKRQAKLEIEKANGKNEERMEPLETNKLWINKDVCHYTALLAELESLGPPWLSALLPLLSFISLLLIGINIRGAVCLVPSGAPGASCFTFPHNVTSISNNLILKHEHRELLNPS